MYSNDALVVASGALNFAFAVATNHLEYASAVANYVPELRIRCGQGRDRIVLLLLQIVTRNVARAVDRAASEYRIVDGQ